MVILSLLRRSFRHLWHTPILATAMASIGWLRGTIDASTYVSSHPPEGTDFATDAVANPMLLRPLSAYTVKAIWEIKTSMAGLILGLLIIFAIKYTRSPWRNLPPRPRRLPILVYALQLRDKTWLLSKDCKERFGKFYRLNTQSGHLRCSEAFSIVLEMTL